ncbi:VOC family protein, partial [Cellulomonas fimi]
MRLTVTSVFVDDQAKALDFYTRVLGFVLKHDVPLGEDRWLTVVSPAAPDGVELLLEPDTHPVVGPYKAGLVEDGIPAASFGVVVGVMPPLQVVPSSANDVGAGLAVPFHAPLKPNDTL